MTQQITFHAGPAARLTYRIAAMGRVFMVVLFAALGLPILWLGLYGDSSSALLIGGLCMLFALGFLLLRIPIYNAGTPLLSVSAKGVRVYPASNTRQREPIALDWTQIAAIAVHHPPRSRPSLRITPTDDAARTLGLRGPQWRPSVLTRWTRARLHILVDLFDCGQDTLMRHLAEAASQSQGPARVVPRWDNGARLILAPPTALPESAA
ncbi:hypothetical protein [Pseudotabrizicola sp.]|uniref:hypothetical protein n=1 Tax=Pseudotabrizicola sp. TaxID=2939647 RepID=UPI00271EA8E2|nr:hypothetical protein [Pseudotabrizicola sp.]MDO8884841.1 hypothetical protein [Pseudotabrizicola sp.]